MKSVKNNKQFETIRERGKEFFSSSRRASRKIMAQHSDAIIKILHKYKGKHLTVYKIKLYLNENNIELFKNLWLEYKENTEDKAKIQI